MNLYFSSRYPPISWQILVWLHPRSNDIDNRKQFIVMLVSKRMWFGNWCARPVQTSTDLPINLLFSLQRWVSVEQLAQPRAYIRFMCSLQQQLRYKHYSACNRNWIFYRSLYFYRPGKMGGYNHFRRTNSKVYLVYVEWLRVLVNVYSDKGSG